ncbi:hypothetical protein D9611_002659 [Ephemerocybe angulata]|uniref:F-box domain-containing protein n=1 Tax=Ephemerocybe angulata TaxID=980116 RepID=A0A8H5FE27_9AGAR|nr:hypothetical protein D9611_002659 [Tulosesus angulatus]
MKAPRLSLSQDIPGEILEQIFFQAALSSELDEDPLLPLKSLNLVSQQWRSAFLSSPRLWRNLGSLRIKGPNYRPRPQTDSRFFQGLKRHLDRAKSQPLIFSFDQGLTYNNGDFQAAVQTLTLLSQYATQWYDVELCLQSGALNALAGVKGRFELLEKLSLTIRDGTPSPAFLHRLNSAPRLECYSIQISGHHWDEPQLELNLPWPQLVKYHERTALSETWFHRAITSSPRLQSLECDFHGSFPPIIADIPLRHACLTRLGLQFDTFDSRFFQSLVLPALLDLNVVASIATTIFSDIASLITRSKCLLQSLTILPRYEYWHELSGKVTHVLGVCPKLETLCVNGLPRSDMKELVGAWAEGGRDEEGVGKSGQTWLPKLVPKLRRFTFQYSLVYPSPESDYSALNLLARAREEMYRNGVTQQLLEMNIITGLGEDLFLRLLRQLESLPSIQAPAMAPMIHWAEVLRLQLNKTHTEPRFRYSWVPHTPRWYKALVGLAQVVKEMEAYSIVGSDIGLLYRTNIPALLDQVASLPSSMLSPSQVAGFLDRLRKLLERWKPIIIEDARVNRWWMRRGINRFEYVHRDSDWREADARVWQMVIGAPAKPMRKKKL